MYGTEHGQPTAQATSPADHVNTPAQAPQDPAEVDARIAVDLHDILVNQIFAVSLDLHAALSLTADTQAAARIAHAIGGLDHAITDLRRTLFDLAWRTGPTAVQQPPGPGRTPRGARERIAPPPGG